MATTTNAPQSKAKARIEVFSSGAWHTVRSGLTYDWAIIIANDLGRRGQAAWVVVEA